MQLHERIIRWTQTFTKRWKFNAGVVGARLKYGYEKGSMTGTEITMAASVIMKAASGRFVTLDASGYGQLIPSTSTSTIFGFVLAPQETTSATKGTTSYYCITNPDAIFRVPCTGTFALTDRGKTAALIVTNSIQYALIGTTAPALLRIVGGTTAGGWVDVQMIAINRTI